MPDCPSSKLEFYSSIPTDSRNPQNSACNCLYPDLSCFKTKSTAKQTVPTISATGCHFTGPIALRPRLSSSLPISLL